jgi:hypothetical protein
MGDVPAECPSPTTLACPSTDTSLDCPKNNVETAVVEPENPATKNSIASKAMASGILVTAAPALMLATTGLGAADEVIKTVKPIIKQGIKVFEELNSLTQLPNLNAKNALSASIDTEAFKIASNKLLESFNESNKGATPDQLAANLKKFLSDKEIIETTMTQRVPKVGGKKIISRTHKSINQFLNPKITAANMLKSKKLFRNNTKSKYKYKSKKRRFH